MNWIRKYYIKWILWNLKKELKDKHLFFYELIENQSGVKLSDVGTVVICSFDGAICYFMPNSLKIFSFEGNKK